MKSVLKDITVNVTGKFSITYTFTGEKVDHHDSFDIEEERIADLLEEIIEDELGGHTDVTIKNFTVIGVQDAGKEYDPD